MGIQRMDSAGISWESTYVVRIFPLYSWGSLLGFPSRVRLREVAQSSLKETPMSGLMAAAATELASARFWG